MFLPLLPPENLDETIALQTKNKLEKNVTDNKNKLFPGMINLAIFPNL